jgi:hypothetical protein
MPRHPITAPHRDPFDASRAVLEGRAQVDRVVTFLRQEFGDVFGRARMRSTSPAQARSISSISSRSRPGSSRILMAAAEFSKIEAGARSSEFD